MWCYRIALSGGVSQKPLLEFLKTLIINLKRKHMKHLFLLPITLLASFIYIIVFILSILISLILWDHDILVDLLETNEEVWSRIWSHHKLPK